MNSSLKGALAFLIIGLLVMAGFRFVKPIFDDKKAIQASDAKDTKGRIVIGMDNFIGYFPLCSPEMKRRMRQTGYLLECQDDGADYTKRMQALDRNKINFAVATVDSYVLNGAEENYPGTIITVLDESKGGDALVAWKNKLQTLNDFRNQQDLKIAFTPDSPSHHLLKALAVHFDIEQLKNDSGWEVKTDGSEDALKRLLNKEVDAAVLWEPDVSRATKEDNILRVLGTEKTQQLIVDILIVNRSYSKEHPDIVKTLLKEYFRTLKYYRGKHDHLVKDVRKATDLSNKEVESLLKGVEWQTLSQNAEKWFGTSQTGSLAEEALIDTIEAAVGILKDYGSIDVNPIPNRDPYVLTNSQFISHLFDSMLASSGFGQKQTIHQQAFDVLSDSEWNQLKELGTLKVRPIIFASGSDQLTMDGKQQLDLAAENLKHYPAFRISVRGHTGLRGDKEANLVLSQDRADAVIRYLDITHSINDARLRAEGYGGNKALPRKPGESNRAYNYRLPRVELVLMGEDI